MRPVAATRPTHSVPAGTAFVLVAIAVCISATFSILLPVVPVLVERIGPHGAAGGATAALFFGAVTGELLTPWLISRLSSTRVLVAGQLVTAVTSLVYIFPSATEWEMIGAAGARGVGMGFSIVVSVVLLSELTAPHRRGSSIGYFGFALSVPGVFLPSIGVYLLSGGHAAVAALIAFVFSLAGAAFALKVPARNAETAQASTNLLSAIRRPGLFAIFAGFVLTSCSFGGVITYAPVALPLNGIGSAAAFLLVAGAARAASRWLAGLLGDRRPPRTVLIGGMATALIGLVMLAQHGGPALVIVSALAYGTGFGAVQTAAFLAMTERGTAADAGPISALWNGAIDFGASVGGTLIGLAAARYGYDAAIWVLPIVVACSLPLFLVRTRPLTVAIAEAETLIR
jgi:predicted MFS family arabinose efflux permease